MKQRNVIDGVFFIHEDLALVVKDMIFDLGQGLFRISIGKKAKIVQRPGIEKYQNAGEMQMNQQPTFLLDRCKGVSERQCPHALFSIDTFIVGLGKKIEEAGWEEFLLRTYGGKHHFHHAFRVAVSGCANSCARSHIADLGLIRAQRPILEPGRCNGCEACVEACPDNVISMVDGCPVIDRDECLLCGLCVQACPEHAMQVGKEGWRVLVGGRLGRRPQLAWELPELRSDEEVFAILDRSLKLYMKNYRKGLRFGALLSRIGLDFLEKNDVELDVGVC